MKSLLSPEEKLLGLKILKKTYNKNISIIPPNKITKNKTTDQEPNEKNNVVHVKAMMK